jgi:dihydroorotate dehydrogenase electron transfer subunit
MKQFVAEVMNNIRIARGYYEMSFIWPFELDRPLPGQFFELRCCEGTTPLLRRPFAFSGFDFKAHEVSFIFEVRGIGTEIISSLQPAGSIDVIAPLGNSFPEFQSKLRSGSPAADTDPVADRNSLCVLVSGGVGLGPILFLARTLENAGARYVFIHGVREASLVPESASLDGLSPVFCTDDGSAGFHGTTTDYLWSIMSTLGPHPVLYACGPLPMLRACHEISKAHHFDCFVSMEQIMGCGFGACMGCAIKIAGNSGFARVCEEGPVFSSGEIVWT